MSDPAEPKRPSAADERAARLKAQLRANLQRRKGQARGRRTDGADDSAGDDGDAGTAPSPT